MKAEEILKDMKNNEKECGVCALHTKAYDIIPNGIECPNCHHIIETHFWMDEDDYQVVSENNTTEPDQTIQKYPVCRCDCGTTVALIPTKITYNANHDIYYTGGKDYLQEDIKGIQEAILPSIEQYTERIKKGEKLDHSNLSLWLERDIEHLVAKYLYENGFKK